MSSTVRALIVDDDEKERTALADLLNGAGAELTVTAVAPAADVEGTAAMIRERLPDGEPRLLLLDYRLEDNPLSGSEHASFRGGTVAGYIRDVDPDLPIVLLTSEEKLHEFVERRPGVKDFFDWTLLKSAISNRAGAAVGHTKIVAFANAWRRALGWPNDQDETWERLEELMHAPPDGIVYFKNLEAEPPRGDVPGDVIHWLAYRALRLPGPLVGADAVRVTLGLSPQAFQDPKVRIWLEDARYDGALAQAEERWWAHLVRGKLATAADGVRPLEASDRVVAIAKAVHRKKLEHEGCSWCGSPRTLGACMVCGQATDAAHAVRPLTQPLPAWADAFVVCYQCIALGRADEQRLRFPPQTEEIVSGLREDRIRPPGE
jgi:CheY-like chemotaxis protein